jgi:hypothetical protein
MRASTVRARSRPLHQPRLWLGSLPRCAGVDAGRAKLNRFTIHCLMLVLGKLDQRMEVEVRFGERAA